MDKKKFVKGSLIAAGALTVGYFITKKIAKTKADKKAKELNVNNPYITGEEKKRIGTTYEQSLKPTMDRILAYCGLVVLAPVYAGIALAIYLDDPGTVLFTQKRVGKNKEFFELHKFRSMKMCTPHDMPTHMLENPEQYITKVGKFIRKYSLDELPQIWDILSGKMSIIGPRPALWNQDDLVAEREKWGANDVVPGLTGWAQINGRDELEIPVKASLDGNYVEHIGFKRDLMCFFGTIGSVLNHDGVVEGGTGENEIEFRDGTIDDDNLRKNIMIGAGVSAVAGVTGLGALYLGYQFLNGKAKLPSHFLAKSVGAISAAELAATVYANLKRSVALQDKFVEDDCDFTRSDFHSARPKRVLIAGANSYLGMAVEAWLNQAGGYEVETVDMIGDSWKDKDFSGFDVVYHVAGLAHADVGNITDEQKALYYKVNTELAVETAKKAKAEGVKQFIFMSSMIVYSGCKEKMITASTEPKPLNFYGESKWLADQQIRELADDTFKVVVLRPPMIYGRGSKGNYPTLAKIAGKVPVFPIVKNKRSMLHVDNLCEFVKLMIDNEESGVFFPQNGEYTNTTDMVQMIASAKGHKIIFVPFVPMKLIEKMPGKIGQLVTKAFGDLAYDMSMSEYKQDYRVNSLLRSIELTEGCESGSSEDNTDNCEVCVG